MWFFGQPRGYKTNKMMIALKQWYVAFALFYRSSQGYSCCRSSNLEAIRTGKISTKRAETTYLSRYSVPQWHERSKFSGPPMLACKYVEGIGFAAMLTTEILTIVLPEVNFRENVTHTPLPSVNKAAHSGFETHRRHHQKSKIGVLVDPQKGLMSSIFFKKKVQG